MIFWSAGFMMLLQGGLIHATEPSNNFSRIIDSHFEKVWKENQVTPTRRTNDAEFIRRLYLDLFGRIPRIGELQAVLPTDGALDRSDLIDEMLIHPEHANNMSVHLGKMILAGGDRNASRQVQSNLLAWLTKKYQQQRPYDEVVRTLVSSSPKDTVKPDLDTAYLGPQAFLRANLQKPEMLAGNFANNFLGINLNCAECHDHPFDSWSRVQFWQTAAFFANDGNSKTDQRPQLAIAETKKTVTAAFLKDPSSSWNEKLTPRENLAEWLTKKGNPYFAANTVNQVWRHFFGRALVDGDNAVTQDDVNAALLEKLASEFQTQEFSMQKLIHGVLNSRAYQLASPLTHPSQQPPQFFARMAVRSMTAEQLFDSLAIATGQGDRLQLEESLAQHEQDASPREKFLAKFRPSQESESIDLSILQALILMNGETVGNATTVATSPILQSLVNAPFLNQQQKIEALYIATLSRLPRAEEVQRAERFVANSMATANNETALADLLWALLNSTEFMTNH